MIDPLHSNPVTHLPTLDLDIAILAVQKTIRYATTSNMQTVVQTPLSLSFKTNRHPNRERPVYYRYGASGSEIAYDARNVILQNLLDGDVMERISESSESSGASRGSKTSRGSRRGRISQAGYGVPTVQITPQTPSKESCTEIQTGSEAQTCIHSSCYDSESSFTAPSERWTASTSCSTCSLGLHGRRRSLSRKRLSIVPEANEGRGGGHHCILHGHCWRLVDLTALPMPGLSRLRPLMTDSRPFLDDRPSYDSNDPDASKGVHVGSGASRGRGGLRGSTCSAIDVWLKRVSKEHETRRQRRGEKRVVCEGCGGQVGGSMYVCAIRRCSRGFCRECGEADGGLL